MFFDSLAEIDAYMAANIDKAATPGTVRLDDNVLLTTSTHKTGRTTFTNIYDLQWATNGSVLAAINFHTPTKSITNIIANDASISAIINGGFFYLADKDTESPLHIPLNLAVENGMVLGLPIIDREALVVQAGVLEGRTIQARGSLQIGGETPQTWRGSRTAHHAQSTIFNLGNVHVHYVDDPYLETLRQVDNTSRFTPIIKAGTPLMDLGVVQRGDQLVIVEQDWGGSLDLFKYNFVLRCARSPKAKDMMGKSITIRTIDDLLVRDIRSALTTGPALDAVDFSGHNVNFDLSLCDKPPFVDRRTARLVLLRTDTAYHVVLFDSRKGSATFSGVTPSETRDIVHAMFDDIVWGCFLDSGLTAKIAVRGHADGVRTFGNRHYARLPKKPNDRIHWVPDEGRFVGSSIALRYT